MHSRRTANYPINVIFACLVISLIIIGVAGVYNIEWLANIGIIILILPWGLLVLDMLLALIGFRTIEFYILALSNLVAHSSRIEVLKREL